ncbi:hypothetical protein HB816_08635 [Listeria booriae]|uniref:hypothetical protein n=1 Tax=Listeria booriae TaxID=1552123 RepID=UPI001629A280|nr:hypothetical protein [Listeria booriae]MBC1230508.1 hypothetical protein [Listeria booriae]
MTVYMIATVDGWYIEPLAGARIYTNRKSALKRCAKENEGRTAQSLEYVVLKAESWIKIKTNREVSE